jgi:hypothetical protein
MAPYQRIGPVPPGFDSDRVSAMVAERVQAKKARGFKRADELQAKLDAMGVRLDDRFRTWSVELSLGLAIDAYKHGEVGREEMRRQSARPSLHTPSKRGEGRRVWQRRRARRRGESHQAGARRRRAKPGTSSS